MIVVINLDSHATRETMVHLDMAALGMDWHQTFVVTDEITGQNWTWREHNYVSLNPGHRAGAHLVGARQ